MEIAPFGNRRQYSDYYAYDGFCGEVIGPTESGERMWVMVEGEDEYRSGKKALPPEILVPLANARRKPEREKV